MQCDQIGRNFDVWAHFSAFGRNLFFEKSPKIHLNKLYADSKVVGLAPAQILGI
jgi:hypothetical protein